ncbi:MAG TPA: hypothetical protein DD473_12055 [Planctomycetaceae bacterium]|nr:hypothetical protein [Planctomycetaceae bacterium]
MLPPPILHLNNLSKLPFSHRIPPALPVVKKRIAYLTSVAWFNRFMICEIRARLTLPIVLELVFLGATANEVQLLIRRNKVHNHLG